MPFHQDSALTQTFLAEISLAGHGFSRTVNDIAGKVPECCELSVARLFRSHFSPRGAGFQPTETLSKLRALALMYGFC